MKETRRREPLKAKKMEESEKDAKRSKHVECHERLRAYAQNPPPPWPPCFPGKGNEKKAEPEEGYPHHFFRFLSQKVQNPPGSLSGPRAR